MRQIVVYKNSKKTGGKIMVEKEEPGFDSKTSQNTKQEVDLQSDEDKSQEMYQDAGLVVERALDIGEAMLRSGAEILRVEDTIRRICMAYGGGIVDVFTILSLIIVSWKTNTGENITQTRRIYSYVTNLEHLDRSIVDTLIDYITVDKRIQGTRNVPIEIHWAF